MSFFCFLVFFLCSQDDNSAVIFTDGHLTDASKRFSSISSRVYAISKLQIWGTYLHTSCQASLISGASSALGLSDTDSLLQCLERPMSTFEKWQHCLLEQSQSSTPYKDSVIGQELCAQIFQNWHNIMDYSTVSHQSILYKNFFSRSIVYESMSRYLAHVTKKCLFKFQNETQFQEISHIFCPAIKSYSVQLLDTELTHLPCQPVEPPTFPSLPREDPLNRLGPGKPFLKRTKGVRKEVLKFQSSLIDFVLATKTNTPPRYVKQHAIKKQQFRLYLIQQNKLLLSRIVIKRLAYAEMADLWSFFTFPLCLKNLIDRK